MLYRTLTPAETEYHHAQTLWMLSWVQQRANVLAFVVLQPHTEESGPLGEPAVIYGAIE